MSESAEEFATSSHGEKPWEETGRPTAAKEDLFLRTALAHLILVFIGSVLVHSGLVLGTDNLWASTLYSVGISICTIGVISILHAALVRRRFLRVATESLRTVVKDEAPLLEELFDNAVKKSMPPRYLNIKEAGIIDAYNRLDIEMVRKKIEASCDTKIRIMKIWFPNLYSLESAIIKAIEVGNCTVQIVLLDPDREDSLEAIKKRSERLPYYDVQDTLGQIRKNIKVIESIRSRLSETSRDKLQFRLAGSFVAISLYGYGETFVLGFYLSGQLATEGVQIKVAGSGHPFYNQVYQHFCTEWLAARKHKWGEDEGVQPVHEAEC